MCESEHNFTKLCVSNIALSAALKLIGDAPKYKVYLHLCMYEFVNKFVWKLFYDNYLIMITENDHCSQYIV